MQLRPLFVLMTIAEFIHTYRLQNGSIFTWMFSCIDRWMFRLVHNCYIVTDRWLVMMVFEAHYTQIQSNQGWVCSIENLSSKVKFILYDAQYRHKGLYNLVSDKGKPIPRTKAFNGKRNGRNLKGSTWGCIPLAVEYMSHVLSRKTTVQTIRITRL